MRLLLGLTLLIGAFALVLVWRERSIDAAVASSASTSAPETSTPGWADVRVGRFSGAAALEAPPERRAPPPAPVSVATKPAPAVAPATPANSAAAKAKGPATTNEKREFELTVQHGQTLSEICRAHYKTARVKLVEALAKHNGLRDASALREGAKLRLPPLETLEAR